MEKQCVKMMENFSEEEWMQFSGQHVLYKSIINVVVDIVDWSNCLHPEGKCQGCGFKFYLGSSFVLHACMSHPEHSNTHHSSITIASPLN